MVHAYWRTILSVDDSVGRLRAWLEETGQLDNTIIVFVGDNGLLEGEHGMVDKRTMHEPSIRIPMAVQISGPDPRARVIDQQVLTVDMAPSLLELAGAPALPNWTAVHGSARPQRQIPTGARAGSTTTTTRRSFRTRRTCAASAPRNGSTSTIRTATDRADRHLGELYDLKKDPDEQPTSSNEWTTAATVQRLQTELNELMAATGLTPQTDKIPLDEGIKKELPAQNIR